MSKLALKNRVPREYNQYAIAELFRQLEDQVNRLSEGNASAYHGAMTAAPTIGTWTIGDWILNSAPSAGGYWGFTCIASGSPGTWKGFAVIQA